MALTVGDPLSPPRVYKCHDCRYSFIPVLPAAGCPKCRSRTLLPTLSDAHLMPVLGSAPSARPLTASARGRLMARQAF